MTFGLLHPLVFGLLSGPVRAARLHLFPASRSASSNFCKSSSMECSVIQTSLHSPTHASRRPRTHSPSGFPCSQHSLGVRCLSTIASSTPSVSAGTLEPVALPRWALDALSTVPILASCVSTRTRPVAPGSFLPLPVVSLPVPSPTRRPFPYFCSSFFLSTCAPPTDHSCLPEGSRLLPRWASCKWRRLPFHHGAFYFLVCPLRQTTNKTQQRTQNEEQTAPNMNNQEQTTNHIINTNNTHTTFYCPKQHDFQILKHSVFFSVSDLLHFVCSFHSLFSRIVSNFWKIVNIFYSFNCQPCH